MSIERCDETEHEALVCSECGEQAVCEDGYCTECGYDPQYLEEDDPEGWED